MQKANQEGATGPDSQEKWLLKLHTHTCEHVLGANQSLVK